MLDVPKPLSLPTPTPRAKWRFALPPELTAWIFRAADGVIIASWGLLLANDPHLVAVVLIAYLSFAELAGAYDSDTSFSARRALSRTIKSWCACWLFTLALQILLKSQIALVPGRIAIWLVMGTTCLALVRGLGVAAQRHLRLRGSFDLRLAIYGANELGFELVKYISRHEALTLEIVGIYDERNAARVGQEIGALPLCGDLNTLVADVRLDKIDQVIVALPWSNDLYLRNVMSQLSLTPVRIRLAPDKALLAYPTALWSKLGELPMLTVFERPISGLDRVIKRAEDVVLASVLVLLASPLFVLTALAIKSDSPGPIFFRQPREGFNNHHFKIWKFRSMYVDCAQLGDVTQATRRDARITRVGRFIRRTSIDELPQLFNVLSGEMSLVGPRPHAPSTRAGARRFADIIDTYAARHNVKPGITGWAQACGWRGETDTEAKLVKRVEHDLYYIENWSVGFDIYILLRTVFALIGSRAY